MSPEQKIIIELKNILNSILQEYRTLEAKLPKNDLRLSFYSSPGNVLVSLNLQIHAIDSTICHKSWWLNTFNKEQPSELDMSAIGNLEKFTKHSFLIFFFSRIETNLRKIINLLSPGFDPQNKESFYKIYKEFFIITGLTAYSELFDIIRHIRNSIHSNGTFISPTGNNVTINWDGKIYKFEHLQPINFVTWDETLYLFKEILILTKKILQHNTISSFSFIEDKFY